MYISRPRIDAGSEDQQLAKKPSVRLHRGKGNETTVMVRDDKVRHPITQQWTARYQNTQSPAVDSPVEQSNEKRSGFKKNTY